MNDDDLWLDALLDDELDAAASLALQRRLAAEPGLRARFEARRGLRDVVRAQATRHPAPEALRASLAALAAAPADAGAAAPAGATTPTRATRAHGRERGPGARPWLAALGGAGVATLCTLLAVDPGALGWQRGEAAAALQAAAAAEASEAVSAHTRALLVDHAIEVASADQHTVRPWLSARLNFVPPVVDLAPQGYPLLGARRDVLAGETAAALVYRHGAHLISVFVKPAASGGAAESTRVVRGFNVIERTQGGLAFCFVSDANVGELQALANLVTPLAGR